jgi:hypothetical protein
MFILRKKRAEGSSSNLQKIGLMCLYFGALKVASVAVQQFKLLE